MNGEKDITSAEVVRRCLALYEKTCKDYHRRDIQKNCCNSVAVELEIESGTRKINIMLSKFELNLLSCLP